MSKIKLIAQVSLREAIDRDSEGLDKDLLFAALQVAEEDFSEPVDGATLLMQLAEAKYQVKAGDEFPIKSTKVVRFRRCKLFNETLKKHKGIMPKLAEFIEFKSDTPLGRFGKKDQHFTAGPISDTKVIHCHLSGDVSVLYFRSGREPMNIDLVMVGTHDELGTGQPGNNKVQKQVVKAMQDQVFERKAE